VLVARGGIVTAATGVEIGVFVGATIAVKVSADENVATAYVWICSTPIVGVASGTLPPHETSKIAPSAKKICTFINLFLSIHTPFEESRYFTWISTHDSQYEYPTNFLRPDQPRL
jgi:hypothetical protein